MGIENVGTLCHQTPFSIRGCVAECGVEKKQRIDVVHTLYGFRLEERIEGEADVMTLRQFDYCHTTEDARDASTIDRKVEETIALVVAIECSGHHIAIDPTADVELCRGL